MLVFGVVGAGKSIWLTDLWAQIGHNFQYALFVEEGLSHGTTVQTAGSKPIVITSGGSITINYLDLRGLPFSTEHLGGAVSLCLQMLRETGPGSDQSRVSAIQSCLANHITALYDAAWEEWARRRREEVNRIARRAYLIEKYRLQMPGEGNTFLDAWAQLRDSSACLEDVDDHEVAKFATHHSTKSLVRDLGLSYLSPEEMPTHSQLVELMTLTPLEARGVNAEEIGDRLSVWKASGPYGRLFDGVTTSRLNQDVTDFELSKIPDSMEELKAAAHFLVLNIARQEVIKRPRSERKFILFEEGARVIALPGGAKALKEFYSQMRKYGAVVCTVFQQSAALQCADETVRAAVFDNTKLFIVSAQPSPRAADEISDALELSDAARQIIKRYPLPEHQTGRKFSSFLMVAPDPRRKLVGTFRNVAAPEIVYAGASDNEIFDQRQHDLSKYSDVVTGIITETRKRQNEDK
jgi:hypothetical protein